MISKRSSRGPELVAFEDAADHLHLLHGQSGEIGEGALFNLGAVAEALAGLALRFGTTPMNMDVV